MHLPPFHTLAINMQLFAPLSGVAAVALYPPTSLTDHTRPPAVPTTDSVMEHAKRTGVTAVMAVPSFLEAWCLDREGVEWMKALDFVVRILPFSLFFVFVTHKLTKFYS